MMNDGVTVGRICTVLLQLQNPLGALSPSRGVSVPSRRHSTYHPPRGAGVTDLEHAVLWLDASSGLSPVMPMQMTIGTVRAGQ